MNNAEIKRVMSMTSGATETRQGRETTLFSVRDAFHGQELNLQVKSYCDLKPAHIIEYVAHLKGKGLTARSIQNIMAHLRSALRVFGCKVLLASPLISNSALGLAGASRKGTHQALTHEKFKRAFEGLAVKHLGSAIVLHLQWTLGLRSVEAVRAFESIESWLREIQRGEIRVIFGPKGGHRRTVDVGDGELLEEAKEILQLAAKYLKNHPRFMKSVSLQAAVRNYYRHIEPYGIEGKDASHSLRYTWSRRRFVEYQGTGLSLKEALASLSLDLGHGSGRGRYVRHVYLGPSVQNKSQPNAGANGG
jgi:site-specific recombinase XerC